MNLLVKVAGELNLAAKDLLVNNHGVIIVKWVNTSDHFVGEDSQCPPVNRLAVALVEQHFRRKILGGAAESVSPCFAVLGKAEVSQFQVAILVNQNVFGLEVTVDDVLCVQVLKHETHLR